MTAETPVRQLADAGPDLPGELLDALTEVVVTPADPRTRSLVICALVQQMCSSVAWLHDSDAEVTPVELEESVSIRRLASAAVDHRSRMGGDRFGLAEKEMS